ncbi:hypothetical protein [Oceanicoccus sp. KOV_DT_Chl]|uniref:hypothetical protein n=1 Tax=Oceanicoccus sp. KOV_DT_Chl TaxID=1904639 RepID=UPI00135A99A7|nr:hypothetical protein [Oceanicoccus sp. KOV_DT_Chl]
MGGPAYVEEDEGGGSGEGFWLTLKDFIELNAVALIGSGLLIALLLLVLSYFS